MSEENQYPHWSRFTFGDKVVRKMDSDTPKEVGIVMKISFCTGGTITIEVAWSDSLASHYQEELIGLDESEVYVAGS